MCIIIFFLHLFLNIVLSMNYLIEFICMNRKVCVCIYYNVCDQWCVMYLIEKKIKKQWTHTFNSSNGTRHDLVEDMVRTFQRLLGDDTSLLQQVGFDISTSQFARWSEMDTDEFTLYDCNETNNNAHNAH